MAKVDTLILLTSGYFAGKTAAFCIPLLEKLKTEETHVQGLIIVPTRELALWVAFLQQPSSPVGDPSFCTQGRFHMATPKLSVGISMLSEAREGVHQW